MKKTLLLALMLYGSYHMNAQSFTVNNTSDCSVSFSVVASDPNTCNAAYTSQTVTLAAGASVTYNGANDLSWTAPNTAPSNAHWSGIVILDDGQLKFAGEDCAGFSSSINFTSGDGTAETASYSVNEALDNIIIIWPNGG